MSLDHGFFCLKEGDVGYTEYMKYVRIKPDVTLHTDFISYICDTLLWVPCKHMLSENHYHDMFGLALFGVTIINLEGIDIFQHVIKSWMSLFSKAPEKFELKGGYMIGKDGDRGKYNMITFERDKLLHDLQNLSDLANKASSGEFFIMHLGI